MVAGSWENTQVNAWNNMLAANKANTKMLSDLGACALLHLQGRIDECQYMGKSIKIMMDYV